MKRFFVCRAYFKWKGKMYLKGDLLPETFTHHDKARSIYNSRIGECEVEDISPENSFKRPSAIPTPITKPLTGNMVVSNRPLEVESLKIPDEVPEVKAAEIIETVEIKPFKVTDKGTESAAFDLLNNFTPGTQQ